MIRMRHMVAVMVVAGVLGADRLAMAAPIRAPQLSQAVRQLADRFTGSFSTTLTDVRPQQGHGRVRDDAQRFARPAGPLLVVHEVHSTPFQFRLPPPVE